MSEEEKYQLQILKKSELESTVGYLSKLYSSYSDTIKLIFALILIVLFSRCCGEIFNLLAISYLTAFIINPLVSIFSRYFSRGLSVIIITTLFFLVLFVFFVILIPGILSDYSRFISEVPGLVRNLYIKVKSSSYFTWLVYSDPEATFKITDSISSFVSYENLRTVFSNIFSSFIKGYGAAMALLNFALFPFIVFYISESWDDINRIILKCFPSSYQSLVRSYAHEVELVSNTFIKGQVVIGLILAVLYSIALLVIGLPYAIPIGVFSGFLGIIPYLGLAFGLLLSVLVQGTYDPTFFGFLHLFLAFAVVQFIEGNFITPKVVGEAMGLHPLLVIIALLIGADMFGLTGLLFAIPVATLLKSEFKRRILISS